MKPDQDTEKEKEKETFKGRLGISGRIAKAFLTSKLTPLIVVAALVAGVFAVIVTPREEEPQINVPMVDVFVNDPGASAHEVDNLVTKPMEKLIREIPGVQYVYSISRTGGSLIIVRYYVGKDMDKSLVDLYTKLMSNYDRIPPGVSRPIIKPRSIDDVPILVYNLWSDRYTSYQLRRMAEELSNELKKDPDVSEVHITGGAPRQVRVELDPARLKAYHLPVMAIAQALQGSNFATPEGKLDSGNQSFRVEAGGFLESAQDVGNVVVGVSDGRPVYLKDVAAINDGPQEPKNYVFMGTGPAFNKKERIGGGLESVKSGTGLYDAVTISVAKKKGTNATLIANRLQKRIGEVRGSLIPDGVKINLARNYGATAEDKSDELLEHMMIATISVIILVALALGWRESVVVAVAVPVTLSLTLLINFLYGYTLNRVTLFALIFSIGILVDDAIVVVENIHRHFKLYGPGKHKVARAVDEVGNPTILATFTVIAALLPMAFVRGLMGPYMRPIPVGASAAMIFSLLIAFIVSPWLSYAVLKKVKHTKEEAGHEKKELRGIDRFYHKALSPLLESRKKRFIVLGGIVGLLLLVVLMVPLKLVMMKMLPFDNKNELQVVIDMPEGTTLETTENVAADMGLYLKTVPEVTDYQIYAGAAAPFNFNGLVRHYYLRQAPNEADIQVNFVDKSQRSAQSHDIAKRIRPALDRIAALYGAKVKIAEIPPGPPVLDTLVAEVYGPSLKGQTELARKIMEIFKSTPGVVDVDWYVEAPQKKLTFTVDKAKAALNGVSTEAAASTLSASMEGLPAGLAHIKDERDPVPIVLRLPENERSSVSSLLGLTVPSNSGALVPLGELVKVKEGTIDQSIYEKNLHRVVYVIGDVAGREESPVYAILKMMGPIGRLQADGSQVKQYFRGQPSLDQSYSVTWDGEWHTTYVTFRDMGIAFAAVLVLIYILVVAWFGDFTVPLIIMAPIPLTLIGILPGHFIFSAFFTATSMIGFIALAGIIVRNSILLVDFVQMEWASCGDLKGALIRAGAVRFRPIALTALAVVVGASVILFDPIFQGLAISLMFGAMSATALTLIAVPLLYYEFFRKKPCPRSKKGEEEKNDVSA
ncbi:MAG: efflux RND transporter permease subunit [Nitrospiraceae bacterium]|nr:efflux RND transporter permease subunit [Nitrospiraceae bacterium]